MADNDDLASWLRLSLIPGVGGVAQRALLARFGLPQHIFSAHLATLSQAVAPALAERLLGHDTENAVSAALAWAAEPGNHILTLADAAYPQRLLETADPPILLYVKGRVDLLNRPALAVVGSRNATGQGIANAEAFAAALAAEGLTIISGLALGIDAAAHLGGLREGQNDYGSTLAVIGTGIDRVYPARNRGLAQQIANNGAIISEFPLGTPAIAANFPRRNRIISGMALGVLVVEAALASGSLITARLAGEQGRDVFALPGSIHSPLSKGCHQLIKQGAKLVDSANDILEELGLEKIAAERKNEAKDETDSNTVVLDSLGFDPCDMDTLAARSGLTPEALCTMLLQLELDNRVATLPGGRYQRLS